MKKAITFCMHCLKEVDYVIEKEIMEKHLVLNDLEIESKMRHTKCAECGENIFVEDIFNEDFYNLYMKYFETKYKINREEFYINFLKDVERTIIINNNKEKEVKIEFEITFPTLILHYIRINEHIGTHYNDYSFKINTFWDLEKNEEKGIYLNFYEKDKNTKKIELKKIIKLNDFEKEFFKEEFKNNFNYELNSLYVLDSKNIEKIDLKNKSIEV